MFTLRSTASHSQGRLVGRPEATDAPESIVGALALPSVRPVDTEAQARAWWKARTKLLAVTADERRIAKRFASVDTDEMF